jgi:hypothetical protein
MARQLLAGPAAPALTKPRAPPSPHAHARAPPRRPPQGRLDDTLQDLLGPIRWSPLAPAGPWQPEIMGLPKRGLLRAALARLRRVPPLARYARDVAGELEEAEAYAAREAARASGGGGGGGGAGRGGRGVIGFDLGPEPTGGAGGGEAEEEQEQEQRAPEQEGGAGSGGSPGGTKTPVRRVPAAGEGGGGGAVGVANCDAGQRPPLQQLP